MSGYVYLNVNNNGIMDPGEIGLRGVTVVLTGADSQGDPVNLTTTTGANGLYVFAGLLPGTYTLSRVNPSGYRAGLASYGNQSNSGTTPGNLAGISLGLNITGLNNNFAEIAVASKVLLLSSSSK